MGFHDYLRMVMGWWNVGPAAAGPPEGMVLTMPRRQTYVMATRQIYPMPMRRR